MPSFEEFSRHTRPKRAEPLVTIQRKGTFTLNQSAHEALDKPEAVVLLMDVKEQIMAFRAAQPSELNAYRLRAAATGSTFLVSGKAFCDFYDISMDQTRNYNAEMIGSVLAVDLKQQASDASRGAATGGDEG